MNRLIQGILVVVGVVICFLLFLQPKFIVNNEETKLEQTTSEKVEREVAETSQNVSMHQNARSAEDEEKLKKWTTDFNHFTSKEKKVILADSLANLYTRLFEFDSAAKYFEQQVFLFPTETNKLKAALGLYQAFKVSMNPVNRKKTGLQALAYIDEILATRSNWVDLKVKKAVIRVYTETPPMGGINMLKEIIAENPTHVEARLTLGEFMLTVKKVEKAIEQFEAVITVESDNEKALLYLIDCYQSTQNMAKAIQYLNKLESLNIEDSYIKSVIEKKRKELN